MERNSKHLKLRIAELKDAIRRKYRQFKDGTVESEKLLEKQYDPIIKQLKKSQTTDEVKLEPKEEADEPTIEGEFFPDFKSSPNTTAVRTLDDEEIFGDREDVSGALATPEGRLEASRYIEQHFQHPLTRKYMLKLVKDSDGRNRIIDHDYGPRYEGDTLMIGDKPVQFDDSGKVIINNISYNPTEGLYELLFKRLPDDEIYTDEDLSAYKNILNSTNAHKKNYKYSGNIKRNKTLKYKHVIQKLFPVKSGKGMKWKTTKSRDILHWDDPNELVDRLKLLAMSAETGNTSHTNEILNIVDELREAGYIKGAGNSRFKSLL